MRRHRIALLPGDGIGREVAPAAVTVLDAAAARGGFALEWRSFDWSCETFRATGRMMPDDGIERLADHDAIFLGAVGFPGVPDHVSLWGLLLPIRRQFDQFVNLRPVKTLPGLRSPLADAPSLDFWIVRENTEGEYSQIGGRSHVGTEAETVFQAAIFTRHGTDRILRYAFELAQQLGRPHVSLATKSNGLFHSMPFWDERFATIATDYPDVRTDQHHIDILCARFVQQPTFFDIVVGSNLFGDILSDLGPSLTGAFAVAPSANIDPTRRHPSMFEPVHGSAPDIAGRGVANPIGQIWAGAMMLDHLGEAETAGQVMAAVERVLAAGVVRTPDLGGGAMTDELADAIVMALDSADVS